MQIDLGRIALVLACLLEIDTIRVDLPRDLGLEDGCPLGSPAARVRRLGQDGPDVEQPERLARQVRIRTVICRKVALDVPRMSRERGHERICRCGLQGASRSIHSSQHQAIAR